MSPLDQRLGIDECYCSAVRKASRQISRLYDSHLEPSGLRITQFLALAALNEVGRAPVNALAERLAIEPDGDGKDGWFSRTRWLRHNQAVTRQTAEAALWSSRKKDDARTTERLLSGAIGTINPASIKPKCLRFRPTKFGRQSTSTWTARSTSSIRCRIAGAWCSF